MATDTPAEDTPEQRAEAAPEAAETAPWKGRVPERVREAWTGAAETVSRQAHALGAAGDEWAESCRRTVQRNPLAALGTAFAAGFLVAQVLNRRR